MDLVAARALVAGYVGWRTTGEREYPLGYSVHDMRHPARSDCATCDRRLWRQPWPACSAYPDGIPDPILAGRERHLAPNGDDGGVAYLPNVYAIARRFGRRIAMRRLDGVAPGP